MTHTTQLETQRALIELPTEIELLRQDVSNLMETTRQFRSGNTSLIRLLARAYQDQVGKPEIKIKLVECGVWNTVTQSVDMSSVDARDQDSRWTWEETVRYLVKDPGTVVRLLSMGDQYTDNQWALLEQQVTILECLLDQLEPQHLSDPRLPALLSRLGRSMSATLKAPPTAEGAAS